MGKYTYVMYSYTGIKYTGTIHDTGIEYEYRAIYRYQHYWGFEMPSIVPIQALLKNNWIVVCHT